MFGYFKVDRHCPGALRKVHKKYYCYLCRSLKRHYGGFSHYLLSYDVAFFLMLTARGSCLDGICKVGCHCTPPHLKTALEATESKAAAALNILLVAAKLEDDILDEGRFSARLTRRFFARVIRKAKADAPRMWEIIRTQYHALRSLETENAGLPALEACFAKMMEQVAQEVFGVRDEARLEALQTASKWLYFIDALDDLDADLRKGCFNPLAEYGSFQVLKDRNYPFLCEHIRSLYPTPPKTLPQTPAGEMVEWMLCHGIPKTSVAVMTRRRKK